LPFEVTCPKNRDGHLVPRRARRTGSVFWGCSNYPRCDYTTNHEPLGGLHDADDGPLARKDEAAICLICGSTSDVAAADVIPGERYSGGPANPEALARPARARRGGAPGGAKAAGRGRGGARGGPRSSTRRTSAVEPAPDA
jgi:topoisomerase-like DNA binding C4 zinc finger protein